MKYRLRCTEVGRGEKKKKSLPRQICVIVAVTNAIITGVGVAGQRGGQRATAEEKAEGGALTLALRPNMQ